MCKLYVNILVPQKLIQANDNNVDDACAEEKENLMEVGMCMRMRRSLDL